ncbi:MAG TPA: hypothetical protein ENK65_00045 [Helicobacteraceae bacterium]|nr:hypothetical protein [Helicobacteraceae bacterium]
MQKFFTVTYTPFILFASLFTAGAGILAIFPKQIESLFHIEFHEPYQLLIQHWGFTTFIIAIILLSSIWKTAWRTPIIVLTALEKCYMAFLFLTLPATWTAGFRNVALMDTAISLYMFLYLYSMYQEKKSKHL